MITTSPTELLMASSFPTTSWEGTSAEAPLPTASKCNTQHVTNLSTTYGLPTCTNLNSLGLGATDLDRALALFGCPASAHVNRM
jgi:hypothetical protein